MYIQFLQVKGKMTFRECGLGSLPELLFMLISVALGSYAVAFAWIEYIDDFYEPGEVPNINAATQVLGLIVGFLFVGLIRESKDQWRRTMETANDFMLTTHSMVLEAKREQTNVLQPIRRVRETVRAFYVDKTTRLGRLVNLLCCRGDRLVAVKVQACLAIREKMDDLQRSIPASNGRLRSLFSKLEGLTSSMESHFFRERGAVLHVASPDPAVCLLRGIASSAVQHVRPRRYAGAVPHHHLLPLQLCPAFECVPEPHHAPGAECLL